MLASVVDEGEWKHGCAYIKWVAVRNADVRQSSHVCHTAYRVSHRQLQLRFQIALEHSHGLTHLELPTTRMRNEVHGHMTRAGHSHSQTYLGAVVGAVRELEADLGRSTTRPERHAPEAAKGEWPTVSSASQMSTASHSFAVSSPDADKSRVPNLAWHGGRKSLN